MSITLLMTEGDAVSQINSLVMHMEYTALGTKLSLSLIVNSMSHL